MKNQLQESNYCLTNLSHDYVPLNYKKKTKNKKYMYKKIEQQGLLNQGWGVRNFQIQVQ